MKVINISLSLILFLESTLAMDQIPLRSTTVLTQNQEMNILEHSTQLLEHLKAIKSGLEKDINNQTIKLTNCTSKSRSNRGKQIKNKPKSNEVHRNGLFLVKQLGKINLFIDYMKSPRNQKYFIDSVKVDEKYIMNYIAKLPDNITNFQIKSADTLRSDFEKQYIKRHNNTQIKHPFLSIYIFFSLLLQCYSSSAMDNTRLLQQRQYVTPNIIPDTHFCPSLFLNTTALFTTPTISSLIHRENTPPPICIINSNISRQPRYLDLHHLSTHQGSNNIRDYKKTVSPKHHQKVTSAPIYSRQQILSDEIIETRSICRSLLNTFDSSNDLHEMIGIKINDISVAISEDAPQELEHKVNLSSIISNQDGYRHLKNCEDRLYDLFPRWPFISFGGH